MSFSDGLRSSTFERWLRRELARPVPVDRDARRRIMERVRAIAPETGRGTRSIGDPGARSRPRIVYASPWIGSALAAGLAAIITAGGLRMSAERMEALVSTHSTLGDTVAGAFVDTLRVVRFFLAAPGARSVALVGDFNRWDPRALPLRADEKGGWSAAVPLPDGWHRYAFVVDDTQWVADPAADSGRTHDGRRTSRLQVNTAAR